MPMQITRIQITERRIDPLNRHEQALVHFHAKGRMLQVIARAARGASVFDLTRDALRQLRRMPEFRSGAEVLQFDTLCLSTG